MLVGADYPHVGICMTVDDRFEVHLESAVAAALDENLSFYSPDVEYQIGDIYMVADGYAVVMLDADGVNYRALMNNNGDGWGVLSYPRIVFSYEDFLDVPEEVLKKANEVGR